MTFTVSLRRRAALTAAAVAAGVLATLAPAAPAAAMAPACHPDGFDSQFAWPPVGATTTDARSDWLDVVNETRAQAGLAPVKEMPALSQAAAKHNTWMRLNSQVEHVEQQGTPGFTEEGCEAGSTGVVLNGAPSPTAAVERWATGPFHTLPMLDPRTRSVGFALDNSDGRGFATMTTADEVVMSEDELQEQYPSPRTYPGNGKVTALRFYTPGEMPSPIRYCPGNTEDGSGLPLLAMFGPHHADLANVTATLTETAPGGARRSVNVCTFASGKAPPLALVGAVVVLPTEPLRPGHSYSAAVSASDESNGEALSASWSFSTTPRTPTVTITRADPPNYAGGNAALRMEVTDPGAGGTRPGMGALGPQGTLALQVRPSGSGTWTTVTSVDAAAGAASLYANPAMSGVTEVRAVFTGTKGWGSASTETSVAAPEPPIEPDTSTLTVSGRSPAPSSVLAGTRVTVTGMLSGERTSRQGATVELLLTPTGSPSSTVLGTTTASATGSFTLSGTPTRSGTLTVRYAGSDSAEGATAAVGAYTVRQASAVVITRRSPTSSTVTSGTKAVIYGALTGSGAGSQLVTLVLTPSARGAAAQAIGSARTNAAGMFTVAGYVKVAGTLSVLYSGSAELTPAAATVGRYTAVSRGSWSTSSSSRRNTTAYFPVTVAPAGAGRRVTLQYWTGRTWTTLSSATTDRYGRATPKFRFTRATSYRLRVVVSADSWAAGSITAYRSHRVR